MKQSPRVRDVIGGERTMLEPEVVAATIRGIRSACGIEPRKFEALPSSPKPTKSTVRAHDYNLAGDRRLAQGWKA
jgi:hypothetical protein